MKILDKAVALEQALLRRIKPRTGIARHPLEICGAVLDEIEDATEPGPRGTRLFPYNRITIIVPTRGERERATADAVFKGPPALEARVRDRLRQRGCAVDDALTITVKFVDRAPAETSDYRLELRRRATPRAPEHAPKKTTGTSAVHLTVLAGSSLKPRYVCRTEQMNIGRCAEVLDRQQRVLRHNQVVFLDADDDISHSVSRAHAHVRLAAESGEARIHDDGSTHGTRVIRDGRTIEVPRGSGRGIRLQDGDEVLLGQARIKVEFRPARRR